MNPERTPLAAVAGLSRTAQLPPPPPRRPQKGSDPAPSAPAMTAEPASAATKSEPRPSSKTGRKRVSNDAATMRNISLSLPASLVEEIRTRARRDRSTHAELLLDALTAAEEHLTELLEVAGPQETNEGPFLRRPARPVSADPMSIFTVRMLSPNLDAIDAMVERSSAASRSALCAAALRYYLHTPDVAAT